MHLFYLIRMCILDCQWTFWKWTFFKSLLTSLLCILSGNNAYFSFAQNSLISSNVELDISICSSIYNILSFLQSGKSCLGEIIYRYITAEQFSPECLLDCLDLSSEHHTLEVANRIEAAIHVWRLKGQKKLTPQAKSKKSWGGKVKGLVGDKEKSHVLSERADGLLQSLRLRYPGLPQTSLDMNKIQYNKVMLIRIQLIIYWLSDQKHASTCVAISSLYFFFKSTNRNIHHGFWMLFQDVGQSVLESYSRVLESLAYNIIARIDDVIYVDDATKKSAAAESVSIFNRGVGVPVQKRISPSPFSIQNTPYASPFATPTFCSSTPVTGSPGRVQPPLNKNSLGKQEIKVEKLFSGDLEKVWTYAGNLSARKDAGDAPERDWRGGKGRVARHQEMLLWSVARFSLYRSSMSHFLCFCSKPMIVYFSTYNEWIGIWSDLNRTTCSSSS